VEINPSMNVSMMRRYCAKNCMAKDDLELTALPPIRGEVFEDFSGFFNLPVFMANTGAQDHLADDWQIERCQQESRLVEDESGPAEVYSLSPLRDHGQARLEGH
jgi:hypothetical protein